MQRYSLLVLVVALLATLSGTSNAAEWTGWCGPNGDSSIRDEAWSPETLAKGRLAWRTEVGQGFSSMIVTNGVLYTAGHMDNHDRVVALDATTGEMRWSYALKTPGGGRTGGPRATPIAYRDSIVFLSAEGDLVSLGLKDGAQRWHIRLDPAFGAAKPRWGHAGTPAIVGDKLLLNASVSGIALNAGSGKKIWASAPGVGGYASVVAAPSAGGGTVLVFGESHLRSARLSDGKLLWSHTWKTSWDVNAADPLVLPEGIFISSGYGKGCALLKADSEAVSVIWQNSDLSSHFPAIIPHAGYLYGISGDAGKRAQLVCMRVSDGELVWSEKTGFGTVIRVNDDLVVLTEKGTVLVTAVSPESCNFRVRVESVLPQTCWVTPIYSDGMLWCRNNAGALVALRAGKPQ